MEVYFDNSATTKPYKEVVEKMTEAMMEYYGNPSSAHKLGVKANKKINECRDFIAKTINCTKNEIIFTSGGSESNNFLVRGFVKPGHHVITSAIEHPSVLNTFKELEKNDVEVTYLPVDENGIIDLAMLKESIKKNTVLVSVMHVNNETGVIQPIKQIGNIIKEASNRAKFHVDAVQSFGKLHIDVQKCKIDLMSTSAHKIHGPRGIGFAYVKKGLVPDSLIKGGGQEASFRSGTENLAGIVGMTEAIKIITQNIDDNYEKVKALKAYFIERLSEIKDIQVNSPLKDEFLPYILNVSFKGVRSEVLLHMLGEGNIFVSSGSACSSKDRGFSHVLQAMKIDNKIIDGTIRFSFNANNTNEEVDHTITYLQKSLKFLRR